MPLSVSSDRSTIASIAAHDRWARVGDRTAATAAARAAAEDRFVRQARELHPDGSEELIHKAAENLRQAHARRAARARWSNEKRTAGCDTPAVQESNRDGSANRRRGAV